MDAAVRNTVYRHDGLDGPIGPKNISKRLFTLLKRLIKKCGIGRLKILLHILGNKRIMAFHQRNQYLLPLLEELFIVKRSFNK
jgi:hypothetical protein